MSAEQYWDGDCRLAAAYRKADELRTERRNRELWYQGMYVYDALCAASPLLHAFAKKGTKPNPYSKEPYPITKRELREQRERERREAYENGKRYMARLMAGQNAGKADKKGG